MAKQIANAMALAIAPGIASGWQARLVRDMAHTTPTPLRGAGSGYLTEVYGSSAAEEIIIGEVVDARRRRR